MKRKTFTRNYLWALIVMWIVAAFPATAHIVPPEEFHPLAEAYRRMTFIVNLNPVRWDEVRKDTESIAKEFEAVSHDGAVRYSQTIEALFAAVESESGSGVTPADLRKETARRLFEASTVAVATTLQRHLESARKELSEFERAAQAFETARQIWAAFEHEVRHSDPDGYHRLGGHWLACSSALGSPGLAGIGAIPPDREVFRSESAAIIAYVLDNFGTGYSATPNGALAPLPTASPSYVASAFIPPKLPPGHDINKQLPRPRQVLGMAERGVDESETVLIALGDMAFDSAYIFGEPARSLQISCNTCHNKSITNPRFFIPGISTSKGGLDVSSNYFAPHANNGHYDPIDIPDLRGIRFTAPYGRNGRFASLREFTRNVIVNEFNGPEPDPLLMDGMIAYMNEFEFLPNSLLNRDGTLSERASDSARRGEVLFNKPFDQMNSKSCATCHVPSNYFRDGQIHDIGSVGSPSPYGHDGGMDTPTLLSSKFTAPYFHNGSLATLADVVEWFDAEFELGLSKKEMDDLSTYLDAVGDGEDGYEDTLFTLEAELEEFYFFLSSFEYVDSKSKNEILETLFETISSEIHAHKWDVQDTKHIPVLNQLAALMEEAYAASRSGNQPDRKRAVHEYRTLYKENAEVLR